MAEEEDFAEGVPKGRKGEEGEDNRELHVEQVCFAGLTCHLLREHETPAQSSQMQSTHSDGGI